MWNRALAPLVAVLLLAGCHDFDEHHDHARIFIDVNASKQHLEVYEVALLTSTITTEHGARVKYHAWQLWNGPSNDVWMSCPSCFTTEIDFGQPGTYTISFVVVWWDEDGDERTERHFLEFYISPTATASG